METIAKIPPSHFAIMGETAREDYLFRLKHGELPTFLSDDLERAKELVKKYYPDGDAFAKNRKIKNVAARRALIWILTQQQNRTLYRVGKLFGLDHTTIIHHRNGFENDVCVHPSDKIIKKLFAR